MGTSEEAFHFVDLFAGLGGFHVALEELDGLGVFAAEREPKLKALYKVNFGIDAWGDLNELSSDEIIAFSVPDHHVLTAGGLPPLKWSFAMFRKTAETHGQQATQAGRDCHEVAAG